MATSIDCLSTEILQQIFSLCSRGRDHRTISEVCSRWADAVQHPMMKRICLKVCTISPEKEGVGDGDREGSPTRMKLIDERILQDSNRKYNSLKFEWRKGETGRNLRLLNNHLDLCQERFPALESLFLSVPPNETLVQFFDDRLDWIRNLTELHVDFERFERRPSVYTTDCEVLLPNLKRLWCTISTYDSQDQGDYESSYAFTVNVPELCCLTVNTNGDMMNNERPRRFLEPDVCCLFLPPLKLKTTSKLEKLQMDGFWDLPQRHIDYSEQLLSNLLVLELEFVSSELVMQLWEKCSNLKELSISLDYSSVLEGSLPAMSRNLEKLALRNCSLLLDHEAVFPKLKHIILDGSPTDSDSDTIHLVAPQLISLKALWTESSYLILPHKEQLRTMEVTMGCWIMERNCAPPNVTTLILQWPYHLRTEPRVVQDYLTYFSNLRHLKIYGKDISYLLQFPPVNDLPAIPRLESFSAHQLILRLADFKRFTGLKTLVLSECIIKAESNDDGVVAEVTLPALEYCRVQHVAVEGYGEGGDGFPIRVDARRVSPPIDMICVSAKGRKVFNSRTGGVQQPCSGGILPEQF